MKINYRQLAVLVFMSFIALKILALPGLLYAESGNMSWLVTLILMLVDTFYAILIIGLIKKAGNKNILEFMTEIMGPVLPRILMFILILKYGLVVANISKGLEFFVVENFYNELNWIVFVLPLILLTGFMVYKGLRNIARVSEMIYFAVFIGCLYIALKSIAGVDIFNFLPFFKDGVKPLFEAGFNHLSWFGSGTFLLMLFGKVDFSNEKRFTMFKFIAFAFILVLLVHFVFYGLFDVTSPTHAFCISDISQFSSGKSSIDELSWLVVSLWVTAQAVQLSMFGYCMVQAIKFTFNIKNNVFPILVLLIYIFMWSVIGENTVRLEVVFLSTFASVLTIVSQYIIPLILWLGWAVKNGGGKAKKSKKQKNSTKNGKILQKNALKTPKTDKNNKKLSQKGVV